MGTSELHITMGPMFSGKTSKLIETYETYKNIKNVCVLSYSEDTRYSNTEVVNHNKKAINSIRVSNIKEFIETPNLLISTNVLLIDEAQFFTDLLLVKDILDNYDIIIYIFGLDADFNRNKFGQILDLIPYCDSVEKLNAFCVSCKNNYINTKAIYSFRTTHSDSQILIGSGESYIPVCRNCYKELSK